MPRLTVSSDGLKEELINRLPHAHRNLLFDFRQGRWPLLSTNLKADWHALVEAPQSPKSELAATLVDVVPTLPLVDMHLPVRPPHPQFQGKRACADSSGTRRLR